MNKLIHQSPCHQGVHGKYHYQGQHELEEKEQVIKWLNTYKANEKLDQLFDSHANKIDHQNYDK